MHPRIFSLMTPLSQFEIVPLAKIGWFGVPISWLQQCCAAGLLIFGQLMEKSNLVLKQTNLYIFQNLITIFFKNTSKLFYNFFILFLLVILFCISAFNLLGMISFSFTSTSHILFTILLSFFFFIGLNVYGIQRHGVSFLTLFCPAGISKNLLPFLFIIELISYVARLFSLAIRLFANIMAGHTLLTILTGFIWVLIVSLKFPLFFVPFPQGIVLLIDILELAIGLLQAYVFVLLLIIYTQDVIYLH